jgi:hypothetical protein
MRTTTRTANLANDANRAFSGFARFVVPSEVRA